jgi:hypothetical protein
MLDQCCFDLPGLDPKSANFHLTVEPAVET